MCTKISKVSIPNGNTIIINGYEFKILGINPVKDIDKTDETNGLVNVRSVLYFFVKAKKGKIKYFLLEKVLLLIGNDLQKMNEESKQRIKSWLHTN